MLGGHDEVPSISASPALDKAVLDQQADRLLDGLAGYPKHARQLAFWGQRIASRDQMESDLAAYLLSHVLVSP